uniref:Ycf34 n=1 Tax=Inkyuleea mariana TaxID=123988 RepID=A0A4D6X0F5_9FLOR|nr:hypothetical protein [Inkyuleea mariana]
MCICINCRHANNCNTYYFIKQQHYNYRLKKNTNFIPINTLIKINIIHFMNESKFDWDLIECLSFVEKPGNWLISENFYIN